jgi:ABC-type glycerol-3-phosphate transport system permease component
MSSRKLWPAVVLFLLVLATAIPLYWTILASFTPEARLFQGPSLIPRELITDHYRALFTQRDFWIPIRNSLVVARRR